VLDNVILSPRIAGSTRRPRYACRPSTARDVPAGVDGKLDPSMVVNREVLWSIIPS
jgi:hypothetical protein